MDKPCTKDWGSISICKKVLAILSNYAELIHARQEPFLLSKELFLYFQRCAKPLACTGTKKIAWAAY